MAALECKICASPYEARCGKYCQNCKAISKKVYQAKWLSANAERQRAHTRKHEQKFRDEINARRRAKRRGPAFAAKYSSPKHRINSRVRVGIYQSLKAKKYGMRWESLVGFTLAELMSHLERQFVPGMSWENTEKWHIDHIVPLKEFDFNSHWDAQFSRAWALTNLRPVWASDNLKKQGKRIFLL